jgi:hypothetical protein
MVVGIKRASTYRMWLSNLVCTSSGRTLFFLTQTGSVYIRRTTLIGTSIASFRLVGKAVPMQHEVRH